MELIRKTGFFSLLIAFCLASGFTAQAANLVTDGSFEALPLGVIGGMPTSNLGVWAGDRSYIVGAQDGITPYHGSQMLQYYVTLASSAGSTSADFEQKVNMSAYAAFIDSGEAVVRASAFFNRIQLDGFTDRTFQVAVHALNASRYDIGSQSLSIQTDGDVATWEEAALVWSVPVGNEDPRHYYIGKRRHVE